MKIQFYPLFLLITVFVGCSPKQKDIVVDKNRASKDLEAKIVTTGPIKIVHKTKNLELDWEIESEKSQVVYSVGRHVSGSLEKVRGTIYNKNKPIAEFSADHAEADQAKELLEISGNAQVISNNIKLTAEKVSWISAQKIYLASGNVNIESENYTLGPFSNIRANQDLTDIGTPDHYGGK